MTNLTYWVPVVDLRRERRNVHNNQNILIALPSAINLGVLGAERLPSTSAEVAVTCAAINKKLEEMNSI